MTGQENGEQAGGDDRRVPDGTDGPGGSGGFEGRGGPGSLDSSGGSDRGASRGQQQPAVDGAGAASAEAASTGEDPGPTTVPTAAVSATTPATPISPAAPEAATSPGSVAAPASPATPGSAASAGSAVSRGFALSADTPVEPSAGPTPVVQLDGLGLRGSRGWAFRDLDLVAHRGDLVVIAGPSGTGRSALLLAIAGRLKPTTGTVMVTDAQLDDARHHRTLRQVRDRVAVARIGEHICLDGNLSVEVNARDAADWAKQRPAEVQDYLEDWRTRSGLVLEARTPVAELPALEATALHLLLAAAIGPEVIVLDDADAGLTRTERDQLWQLTAQVAASGPTVIATATDVPPEADVHLLLHRHSGPAAHVASAPLAEDEPQTPDEPPATPPDEPQPPVEPDQPGTDRDGAKK